MKTAAETVMQTATRADLAQLFKAAAESAPAPTIITIAGRSYRAVRVYPPK